MINKNFVISFFLSGVLFFLISPIITKASQEKIIIYSATWCGACNTSKDYLKTNGLVYEVVDITNWTDEKLKKEGIGGVPVIQVGNTKFLGLDDARTSLEQLKNNLMADKEKTDAPTSQNKTKTGGFQLVPCNGVDCSLCDVFVMVNNIYQLLVWIAASFAIGLITYAGITMIVNSANPEKAKKGRELIIQTLIALAIVFGSSLIVNEVLHALAGSSATSDNVFHKFTCESKSPTLGGVGLSKVGGGKITLNGATQNGGGQGGGGGTSAEGQALADKARTLEGHKSTEFCSFDPRNACASVVSDALGLSQADMLKYGTRSVDGVANFVKTQRGYNRKVTDPSQLKPGDIVLLNVGSRYSNDAGGVFSNDPVWSQQANKVGGYPQHVGIYVGNGMIIDNSSEPKGSQGNGVKYRPLTTHTFFGGLGK